MLTICAAILAAALAFNGILNIRGPDFILKALDGWGFPRHFNIFAGIFELVTAVLLLIPAARPTGAALACLCLLTALALIARDRHWLKLEYPLVLLALSLGIIVATTLPMPGVM